MPAGWQIQENIPIIVKDVIIEAGVVENAIIKQPAAPPKKQMIKAVRLLNRSAKRPHGSAHTPNIRYMGNPNSTTSFKFIFNDSINGMVKAGKAIS
jgi:hypothetical protein